MNDPIPTDQGIAAETRLRYDFLEHLGSGGMADVYRARDTELGRDVAIKVFREDLDTVADHHRREREIHLVSGWRTPDSSACTTPARSCTTGADDGTS